MSASLGLTLISCHNPSKTTDIINHYTLEASPPWWLQIISAVATSPELRVRGQELELVTKNVRETEVTVTVAVLVGGRIYNQQMALELPCVAAKLRLKRGSGPVHLIGKEFVGT